MRKSRRQYARPTVVVRPPQHPANLRPSVMLYLQIRDLFQVSYAKIVSLFDLNPRHAKTHNQRRCLPQQARFLLLCVEMVESDDSRALESSPCGFLHKPIALSLSLSSILAQEDEMRGVWVEAAVL
ncbi:hypothetical protein L1987_45780 [Smallanthus sonchifolius]|uniref:Uncharacterized protein n=1 Tax=Smallanthus sonchifolius TaxID=185202 RepID=A0ACB9FYW9_9ASTR|nr:hypothetical protein L1987_45780 [Smallanthus sonchifolius]